MITPYYERDGITLYVGDLLDVLPQIERGPFVCITDPPYNAGKHYGATHNDRLPWPDWCSWWDRCLATITEAGAVDTFAFLSQTAWREYTRLGIQPPDWTLVWSKPLALAVCALPLMPHWEPIAYWGATRRRDGAFWGGDVLTHNVSKNQHGHPTEKPLPLMLELVGRVAGARPILEPFAGSGTTLVAAKALGKRAVGVEINRDYADICIRRLAQTRLPLVIETAEQAEFAL